MIKISDFTKVYRSGFSQKEFFAVKNFSMTCTEGTITGLLGPNGAGKTTLLKAVCAYHFATSGAVYVEGYNAAQEPVAVKNCTGFVEEQSILPSDYRVEEYLRFIAQIHEIPPVSLTNAIDKVISDCNLESVIGKKIHTLSKGFKQRVSFAKALIHDPPVLVLDEPASGLDPAQIVHMRALIKKLAKGRTVLLSTHLMQEVDALCSNLSIISRGICVASGTAQKIINLTGKKTLEEAFLSLTTSQKLNQGEL